MYIQAPIGNVPGNLVLQKAGETFICGTTVDGADTQSITITSSGILSAQTTLPLAAGYLATRSAFIKMMGNEGTGNSGDLRLESGNGSASSVLVYLNSSANGQFKISKHTADVSTDTDLWTCSNAGTWGPGADNTYNLGANDTRPSTAYFYAVHIKADAIFDKAGDNDFYTGTTDGSDSSSLRFCGGGSVTFSGSRGGAIGLWGNEHANTGQIQLEGGAVAAGHISLNTNHASAQIKLRINATDCVTLSPGKLTATLSSSEFDYVASATSGVVYYCGGTTAAVGNGAIIGLGGISASGGQQGGIFIDGGNHANGIIQSRINNSSASFTWKNASNAVVMNVSNGGALALKSTAAVASALFEMSSTTQGFLPPRMTTTQRDAISSPAEGLVIYNTSTHKLNVFTTAWEAVTSA